jgi:hypothetical protein
MVHYVSFGTPRGEYPSCCRAAIVTEVGGWVDVQTTDTAPGLRTVRQRFEPLALALAVETPTGTMRPLRILPGAGEPATHPTPLCGGLFYPGGTWHWPGAQGVAGARP